jgi:Fic family protein
VRFFLRGVADQALDAVERSNRLLTLREEHYGRCQAARSSALMLKLVDALFSAPMTTIPHAATILEVTYRSAQAQADRLVSLGILREATGARRNRVFVAEQILRALEQEPASGGDEARDSSAAPAGG